MTPEQALRLVDPTGQLTKRKSGYWLGAGPERVSTATVQECIRAGWLKSTPSRDTGKIVYAVTLTPDGAEVAGL